MSISTPERITQDKVVTFFKKTLLYNYLGNLKNIENKNIKEDRLIAFLRLKGYNDALINGAIAELKRTATNMQHGVYDANKSVYSLLKYGAKVKVNADATPQTVFFIDFDDPLKNDFAIAEEVTIIDKQEKRPDLVVFLNGIAIAIIELKKSSISVSNGIRQNLTNQRQLFVEPFFTTIQFCMAANEIEGLRYGTLKTSEKYYMEWKQDGFKENQDEREKA